MRILIISQYFWPENFRVNDLAGEFVTRGHSVTVLTGRPNYPSGDIFPEYQEDPDHFSNYAGADVVRVPLSPRGNSKFKLILNYLSFVLWTCAVGPFKLRRRQFDVIFVFEPSPITVGIPAALFRFLKSAPVVLWVLDLWPQTLRTVGEVRSPFLLSLIGKMVTVIYHNCDLILGQSR